MRRRGAPHLELGAQVRTLYEQEMKPLGYADRHAGVVVAAAKEAISGFVLHRLALVIRKASLPVTFPVRIVTAGRPFAQTFRIGGHHAVQQIRISECFLFGFYF